jgi:hypothetical protein
MTTKNSAASQPVGALVAAMVLLAGAAVSVDAQQVGNPGGTAATGSTGYYRTQSTGRVAPKSSRRTSSKRRAVSGTSEAHQQQSKPWSIEDALPDNRYSASRWTDNLPTVSAPQLGRVPLQKGQGSFGLETNTSVKDNQFSDGRTVPGLETVKRDPPSYFGLSLSVPNNSKSFPVPIVPAWGAPE